MLPVTKPARLQKGSTIGIVSVSAPEALLEPERFCRGIAAIEAEGFRVRMGPSTSARQGYLSGDEELMAKDLHDLFADRDVSAVVCAGGGTNANRLLRHLNSEVISQSPKILVGVSNPSVLLNAIYATTGLVTFHGPTVVWNFGEPGGLTPRTHDHFWPILQNPGIPDPFPAKPNWNWWRPGKARGRLVGGNLASLEGLLGTKWAPDWEGHIFFWEDIAKPTNRLDMCLTHFRDAGVFSKIAGMVVGELVSCDPPAGGLSLNEILKDLIGEFDFPVLCNVDLGHTSDKLTLPIGVEACLDSEANSFALTEPAVS
jgi:muramoyltetrapeptide carboxypeptidase